MTIREAIYMTGEGGKIRLGGQIYEVESFDKPLAPQDKHLTASELCSLDWEALKTEWFEHYE